MTVMAADAQDRLELIARIAKGHDLDSGVDDMVERFESILWVATDGEHGQRHDHVPE